MDALLEQLRGAYKRREAERIGDLRIPGWDRPSLVLRIQPLDHPTIRRIRARIPTVRGKVERIAEAEVQANAALVAAATVGVMVGSGGPEVPLTEGVIWDLAADLAEQKGMNEPQGPTDVIRTLAFRDGDILAMATRVGEHSGYAREEIDAEAEGE